MSTATDKPSFKETLNLPQTELPIRAGLAQLEPDLLKKWSEMDLYQQLLNKNANQETFLLHDGPPYPNGDIHLGHALNKILKDIIIRSQSMMGKKTPYIPGWDCHGLPIETQLQKELLKKKEKITNQLEFRKRCHDYAIQYVNSQREQFKRLGNLADWDNPYLTLQPDYEAAVLEVFAQMVEKNYVYKGSKPIHWCTHCRTALAEAEIEYDEHESPSIYMKFKVDGTQWVNHPFNEIKPDEIHPMFGVKASVLVWTTTPWTLPANVAVAVNPKTIYAVVHLKQEDEIFILAESLVAQVMKDLGIQEYEVKGKLDGDALEGLVLHHPFIERESPIVVADYVTAEDGTGAVHIAPGHGQDDHVVGQKYDLPTLMPVDEVGVLTEEAGEFAGNYVFDANPLIIKKMESLRTLLKVRTIKHSYPHCWRCHRPVIFRATPQWFVAMDRGDAGKTIRTHALSEIDNAQWIPEWGKNRIRSMMEKRPDWCISRQRSWGIPIPIFYSKKLEKPLLERKFLDPVIQKVREKGSNIWFELSPAEILGSDFKWEHGLDDLSKDHNIMDVWMESGGSFAAVLEQKLSFPADLYLEGSDQHRGWFHSSLLMSVAVHQRAPYKAVLTHGFTVDDKGRKMSKSLGNTIDPLKVIQQSGADILRLWVASTDFKNDLALAESILKQVKDSFGKIRNTWRFLHSNLFDYENQTVDLLEVDRWMLSKLQRLVEKVQKAYDQYEFHRIYHGVLDFLTNDLSALYLDFQKDNLYCNGPNSKPRRSAQFAFHQILETTLKLLAPILSFSTEAIWKLMEPQSISIHLEDFPKVQSERVDEKLEQKFEKLLKIREAVTQALEPLRKNKEIAASLEAHVVIETPESIEYPELASFLIVSSCEIKKGNELKVMAYKADGDKCQRCWRYDDIKDHLCPRCQEVVKNHPQKVV